MNSTQRIALEQNRPAGLPWVQMPMWFHLATVVYFATNILNGWVFVHMKAPTAATALALWGFTGGFLEHVSPYFPKLYIHPTLEKIVFRFPTVVAALWFGVWIGLAWYVIALVALQSVVFLREEPITSMAPRFHLQHVFGTHLFSTLQMALVVLAVSGQYPLLTAVLMRG